MYPETKNEGVCIAGPCEGQAYSQIGDVLRIHARIGVPSFSPGPDFSHIEFPVVYRWHCMSVADGDTYTLSDTYGFWVEKDTLSSVVERACRALRTPYLACKGYMSSSAMWTSAQRAIKAYDKNDQETLIIHVGDHDPSGIDMTRDNQDRMDLLSDMAGLITVDRIALNMDQIEQYGPPPNPAKVTDSRAKGYIREHGNTSWELDALEPSVIEELIVGRIQMEIDDVWQSDVSREEEGVAIWASLGQNWPAVKNFYPS